MSSRDIGGIPGIQRQPYPALSGLGLTAPDGVDAAYEELLADVLANGVPKGDRTGTGTRSAFARQLRYDLRAGFPRITTKFVAMKAVKGELLWFLRGATNVRWLQERGITIWDAWADADGELGPVYGSQWRSWPARDGQAIDQIARLIETLRRDPDSRRMLVSAWNVGELDAMALAPCHAFFQCYAARGRLSLQVYQRSPSISPPTPCSPTCSPSRPIWRSVSSSGPGATATSTTTTSPRCASNCPAYPPPIPSPRSG